MIILASKSPRRQEILKDILGDIPFKVIPSDFNERTIHEDDVRKLCLIEATNKGKDVALKNPDDIVISSDTMVSYKGKQLGKPKDEDDVYRMLRMITGDTHEVVTAYSIQKGNEELCHRICTATIFIEKMADAEIEMYLATGSPLDKAGAYGIQDKEFIEARVISGDYYTVVGLPKDDLEYDLERLGII